MEAAEMVLRSEDQFRINSELSLTPKRLFQAYAAAF